MKKILMLSITIFCSLAIFAADVWETLEETDVNGIISEKHVVISSNMMKVTNTSQSDEIETFVDLDADKITIISHKQKYFQTIKLSEYVKFAQQLVKELKEKSGSIDPEKVLPKVTFEKDGNEIVGNWNCEIWTVSVDGKPYSRIWLAPELKNKQLVEFKNKFHAIIPESLAKYRSVDSQIDDNFIEKGTIVKSMKIPQNEKMPTVLTTVKKVANIKDIKKLSLTIPAGYADKSAPEMTNTQSK